MKYKSDCNLCQFLGQHQPKNKLDQNYSKIFDLYYCPRGIGGGFIIARYGDDASKTVQCEIYSIREKENVFEVINEGYRRFQETKNI